MLSLEHTQQTKQIGTWIGDETEIKKHPSEIREILKDLNSPCFILKSANKVGVARSGAVYPVGSGKDGIPVLGSLKSQSPENFGNQGFLSLHGVKYPYMAGSMANAISNETLVTEMGEAGMLASFGAGGLSPERLLKGIVTIKNNLPKGPYAFNLIHSPQEPALEQIAVDYYLEHKIKTVEASAFLRLTPPLVQYRIAGLSQDDRGEPVINNRVIAKLSRREVAVQFLNPAPEKILQRLVSEGKITPIQAKLGQKVPMADDITVESDSGGHTDNRPLSGLLPSLIALRDETQAQNNFLVPVRVGAAGGIGTPTAVLGAFTMGADYVVTGSINQGCVEAGTSTRVKAALAEAATTDVMMSPSADMFEMGVKVQVLKRGTMFPMRAQKLYDIYTSHSSIDEIDPEILQELEEKIFQKKVTEIWEDCIRFFTERDPSQIEKAKDNPKRMMALIFRWYLGLATHWGIQGLPERALDYQIWCGPAMGSFNDWVRGSALEPPENRKIVRVAKQLLWGAAYLYRLFDLRYQGFIIPTSWQNTLE